MSDLCKYENRNDWLVWAIELLKRGIWADDMIKVNGGPHASCLWGEAEGWTDGDGVTYGGTFTFSTNSNIRGMYDVRGVRVTCKDTGERFPIRPISDLTPKARRWLRVARRLSSKLIEEAKREARECRAARARLEASFNQHAKTSA